MPILCRARSGISFFYQKHVAGEPEWAASVKCLKRFSLVSQQQFALLQHLVVGRGKMLSNPMLDFAIGLMFLYLLLSIIVTVLQEFISSTLKLRNGNLQRAIVELLGTRISAVSSHIL